MREGTRLRPNGYGIMTGPNGIIEADTLQCVHCACHWQVKPGSGKIRGFCMRCNGPICGPKCSKKCVPAEQQLENIETGKPLDFVPVRSAVPKLWIPGGET